MFNSYDDGNKDDDAGDNQNLPDFEDEYQSWYSEAKLLIKQLLPDRIDDFQRLYEQPRSRDLISPVGYSIEDCLLGNFTFNGKGTVVTGQRNAIRNFQQQLSIVKGLQRRFESSLFDIRLHLQAEMFDDELEAAMYLLKNRFLRAAGAMAGVVLERHLKQVCITHEVKLPKKKHLSISDCNDTLQRENIVDTADWRRIQLLGDIRNKCDHDKEVDPNESDVLELIEGVKKITQSLF
jgi:hypothetical protein